MKKYYFFHPYVMSFFSKDLYKDVGKNWGGIAALYLLLLMALSWIPNMFLIKSNFDLFTQKEAPMIIDQIPTITIQDGKLSIDKPVPYTIKDPETKKPIIIIDTSGKYTDIQQAKVPMLVTQDKVMTYQPKQNEIRTYSLENTPNMTLDNNQLNSLITKATWWLMLVIYPVVVLMTFLYRIIQALIYGALGMIFVKILGASLTYQQSMRLAIVAVTPAIILATIFDFFYINIPYELTFYFLVSMGYLFFAIKSNTSDHNVAINTESPLS